MITIIIEVIPHDKQRYPTCGDWQFYDNDCQLVVRVSQLGDWRYETLVGIHEVVEALLCKHHGISESVVDQFDMNFIGDGEPGDDPGCPYRKEHHFATIIEKLFASALGVDWQVYDKKVEEL